MNTPIINLVLLKRFVTNEPSVFDDTVYSVRYHLQQAGFEVLVSCNVIAPDALNIIWGVGTWGSPTLEQMRQLAKPEYSIIFNMEQLGSDSALVTDEYLQFLSEYRVFDYNQHNIDALQARFPHAQCQEFPLLPAPSFAGDFAVDWTQTNQRADVAFWGTHNDRRLKLLHFLVSKGRDVRALTGHYGQHLSAAVAQSRLCLNAHFYASGIFELARCLRPLAMGMPIVSETSNLPTLVDWRQSGIFFREYDELAASCDELLFQPELLHYSMRQTQHFLNRPDWAELTRQSMLSMVA